MSKKNILTGWVHRLEDGVLKSYGPGDVAPDWVTNPKILTTDAAVKSDDTTPASTDTTPAPPTGTAPAATGDDLDGLAGKELKVIAGELGVAKNGSLDAIRDRIRAKRAESVEEPDADADHEALVEMAKTLGIEVDDAMSDVELQVLIEGA